MGQTTHAPSGPDREATGTHAVLNPAVQVLTQIVHTYAPTRTSTFRPEHWKDLQPDPYALRRVRDALADREGLDLELTAIRIAAEAIDLSPDLHCATITACGGVRRGVSWVKGVSWIMNATSLATSPTVYITAYRLLVQAGAAGQHLCDRGLMNPLAPCGRPDH